MIPSKPEICPYYGKEEREKWHAKRGLKDPLLNKEPAEREIEHSPSLILDVLWPREVAKLEADLSKESANRQEKERARLAQYRAKNREKLAAKARERRAKK
jgi:hypothetical protein